MRDDWDWLQGIFPRRIIRPVMAEIERAVGTLKARTRCFLEHAQLEDSTWVAVGTLGTPQLSLTVWPSASLEGRSPLLQLSSQEIHLCLSSRSLGFLIVIHKSKTGRSALDNTSREGQSIWV